MNRLKFSVLSILTSFAITAAILSLPRNVKVASAYTNGDAATYYNSVGQYSKGSTLTNELNTINNNKRQRLISYNNLADYFDETDPGKSSGQVTAFYSGTSKRYSGNMNREHVWPYSKLYLNGDDRADEGKNEIEQDLHMVRPALKDDNTGRGNSFFTMPDGEGWDPGSLGDETYRGDSARIIFYCTTADLHLTLVDLDFDSKDNHTMGKLSTLLEWNIKYPVSQRERTRNEAVERIQGHRNPFIDHPEYACRIWGNYNETTRRICSAYGAGGELEVKNNNVAYTSIMLEIGETKTLIPSVGNESNISYTYEITSSTGYPISTNYMSIAQTANGVNISGQNAGKTYLKVTANVTLGNGETETLYRIIEVNVTSATFVQELRINRLPNETEYFVGETFDPTGIKVTAVFTNGTTQDVTNEVTYSNTNFNRPGSKYVTVSYTYKGTTVSESFKVTVYQGEDPTPSSSNSSGCGGNVVTSSVILFSLSAISIVLISISKRKRSKK